MNGHADLLAPASTASARTGVNRHFRCFDGLRAIAAFLVVAHHAGFTTGLTFRSDVGAFLARGDIGVPIFFVISGFLLHRPYVAAQFAGVEPLPPLGFYRRRFFRIFPAYWSALVIQLVIGGIVVWGLSGFLWYASLTHIYSSRYDIGGITQAWSLATEISFYVVLPFWAAWMRRLGAGRTINQQALVHLGGCAGLYVLSLAWRVAVWQVQPGWWGITPYWLISLADYFALGMALAVLSAWSDHRTLVRRATDRIGARPWLWWLAAAVAFWFVSTQLDLVRNLARSSFERETFRQFVYGLVGFCLVVPAALGDERRGAVRRFLATPVMLWLGILSYGIYLWHQFFIHWLGEWFDWELFHAPWWATFLGTTVLSVAAAAASWFLIEQPANRWKNPRRRTGRSPDGRARP